MDLKTVKTAGMEFIQSCFLSEEREREREGRVGNIFVEDRPKRQV